MNSISTGSQITHMPNICRCTDTQTERQTTLRASDVAISYAIRAGDVA